MTKETSTSDFLVRLNFHDAYDLLKRTKTEYKEKEKEMEVMVGTRYHDLLESADHIVQMHHNVLKLSDLLHQMPIEWDSLNQSVPVISESVAVPTPSIPKPVETAAPETEFDQMARIVHGPEFMWNEMDNGHVLAAYKEYQYLKELMATESLQKLKQKHRFLQLEYQCIEPFQQRILNCAQRILRQQHAESDIYREALAVLAATDPDSAQLTRFLECRKDWIHSTVARSDLSIQERLGCVFRALIDTIRHLKELNSCDSPWPQSDVGRIFTEWFVSERQGICAEGTKLIETTCTIAELAALQNHLQQCRQKLEFSQHLESLVKDPTKIDVNVFEPGILVQSRRLLEIRFQETVRVLVESVEEHSEKMAQETSYANIINCSIKILAKWTDHCSAIYNDLSVIKVDKLNVLIQEECVKALAQVVEFLSREHNDTSDLFLAQICSGIMCDVESLEKFFTTGSKVEPYDSKQLNELYGDNQGNFHVFCILSRLSHGEPNLFGQISLVFHELRDSYALKWSKAIVDSIQPPPVDESIDFTLSDSDFRKCYGQWKQVSIAMEDEQDDSCYLPVTESSALGHVFFTLNGVLDRIQPHFRDFDYTSTPETAAQDTIEYMAVSTVAARARVYLRQFALQRIDGLYHKVLDRFELKRESCVLQWLFDVHFIRLILGNAAFAEFGFGADATTEENDSMMELTTRLIDLVDPVNWEIYGESLQHHVIAAFNQSRRLFTILTPSPMFQPVLSTKSSDIYQVSLERLQLAVPKARFVLLPVPMSSRRRSKPKIEPSVATTIKTTESKSTTGSLSMMKQTFLTAAASYLRDP